MRAALQVLAVAFLVGAVAGVAWVPETWPMLLGAGLFAFGVFAESFYYRGGTIGGAVGAGGSLQPTPERFLDEESGRLVTVWFNPETGERRYVDEGSAPPV